MPTHVVKKGKQFCVVDASGKVKKGRCHSSRKKALAQNSIINMAYAGIPLKGKKK